MEDKNKAGYVSELWKLTEKEKIRLGLVKKPVLMKDRVSVTIPVHYTSRGVMWETRIVSKNTLNSLKAQYPNMEVMR